MSSKGYATPLRIEVGNNGLLRRLFLLFVILTTLVLLWVPWPLPLSLFLLAAFIVLASRVWSQRAELGGPQVRLVWDAEQHWWWQQQDRTEQLQLLGESYLSTSLVVLNFCKTDSRRRRSVVITPASIGRDTFRQLLVRFKLSAVEELVCR